MAVTDNTYFAPILPDFSQFFGDVDKKAREGGKRAGKAFSDSVGASLKTAERAADKFSDTYKRAQDRAADAAGKTSVAQEKLNEVLNDSTASTSKIRAATERYEKAQRDEARAVAASEKASKNLADAQDQVAKATSEASDEFRMGQDDVDAYGRALDDAADKGRGFGSKLMGGLKTVGVGALLGVGSRMGNAVVDGIRGSFDSGFNRLASVEQAEQMLAGLGHSTATTAEIMDNAMDSVKGTAFGFGEAASMAATFVGAGIPEGEALERVLTLVGDTAAITGSDLNEMGSIWTKVATGARLGTEEMNQLMDRGLGVLPELQKHYGVTADEARKMVTDGKVSFEEFSEIMEDMVGGSAQAMGNTFSGSAANAQAALGRLGASILEPAFDAAPAIFQAIGGGIDHLNSYLTPLIEEWGGKLTPYLEDFANNLGPWLETAIDNVAKVIGDIVTVVGEWVDTFKDIYEWGMANQDWLGVLAAAITGAVGAWKLWTGAIKAWQTVTKIATGIQAAFNAVMAVNPIMLIVMAVAALVAGLVYFFTQTETGKEMWASFTEALGNGWQWVVDKFSAGIDWVKTKWSEFSTAISDFWTSYIEPVFSAISSVVQTVLGVVFAVVVGSALAAWNLLSAGISWAWDTLIKPAWDAMSSAVSTLWSNYVSPIVQWIGDKWAWVSSAISAGVNFLTGVVWPAMTSAISNLWTKYVSPIVQWIGDKWAWVSSAISAGVNFLTGVVWPAMSSAISNLWSKYVSPIVQWIGEKWDWVKDTISTGVDFVTDTVFPAFEGALQGLRDFFGSIVDGIASVWDSLRGALAKPINFMINTVYNDGILSAWNTIAGILPGLEEGSRLSGIREYAVGGAVRGPGTGTSDDIPALLSNGEHVWTAKEVSEAGGQGSIYAMRNAVAAGRGFTYDGHNLALLPNTLNNRVGDLAGAAPGLLVNAYAKGGEVRPLWEAQLMRGHEWAKSRHGRPYVLGGSANGGGGTDCSGFMSGIANVVQGGDGSRQWATMAFNGGGNQQFPSGPQGFVAGLKANTLSIGVTNGGAAGGHTAGTLGAVGAYPATNVESGGAPSMVKYGVGAAGADDGYFNTHYHLPIGPDGAFVSGGNASVSPEAMSSAISKKLGGVIDKILGPVVDLLPSKPPEWQGIPKGMYDKGKNGLTDFVGNAIGQLGDKLASVYSAVEGMGDLVKDAAKGTWGWITDNLDVFDTGGVLKPGAMAVNKSKHPELIINHAQLGAFNRLAGVLGVSAESMDAVSHEVAGAIDGIDSGYGETARYLGDDNALRLLNGVESMHVMAKELNEAYNGGDWGYGELARVLGNEEWALALVNGAADLGEFMRTYGDVVADVGKAVSDHFTTEAGNVLSLWGLEDLAGLEVRDEFKPGNLRAAGENLWAVYNDPNYVHPDNIADEESTITTPSVTTSGVDAVTTTAAASTPETTSTSTTEETMVIKATSADDMVRVGDLEELNGRVVRLEVDMDKAGKVPAGATTRGGVV